MEINMTHHTYRNNKCSQDERRHEQDQSHHTETIGKTHTTKPCKTKKTPKGK